MLAAIAQAAAGIVAIGMFANAASEVAMRTTCPLRFDRANTVRQMAVWATASTLLTFAIVGPGAAPLTNGAAAAVVGVASIVGVNAAGRALRRELDQAAPAHHTPVVG